MIPVLSQETGRSAEIIAAIDRGEVVRVTIKRLKSQGQYAVTARAANVG